MTTDPFTEAARAAAARRADLAAEPLDFEHGLIMKDFLAGAEWARTHLAAQEPTDTDALQERIARALYEEDKRDMANAGLAFDSDAAWEWAHNWTAAVLPIIAAEVQAAKAAAWDEGYIAPIEAAAHNPYRETGARA